jgi:hypothetical protein
MERLVLHRARQAEVAARRPQHIVGRAEDGCDHLRDDRDVEQHLPFGPVQLAAGQARPAEGVAVRPAVPPPPVVEREDIAGHLGAAVGEDLHLCAVEHVGDDDEAVAAEDLHGVAGVAGCENLETTDAGVGFEVGSESDDLGIVLPGSHLPLAHLNHNGPPEGDANVIAITVSNS